MNNEKDNTLTPLRLNAGLGLVARLREFEHDWSDGELMSDACSDAATEIERLRTALVECCHQTESMRVWGGMGWTYHPPQAGRIAKVARAALDA